MAVKMLVWAVILVGLATPVFVAFTSLWAASMSIPRRYSAAKPSVAPLSEPRDNSAQIHDVSASVRIGPVAVRTFPRRWASLLVMFGAVLVVVGCVFLLHVR